MSRADLANTTCSVARAIERIGDPWTLMILREMFLGSRRFDQFQRFTGASPHILSKRLRQLCDDGILTTRQYSDHPPRQDYVLTDKGLDLWPVIIGLRAWGEKWMPEGANAVELIHKPHGHPLKPVLVCSDCGEPVTARDSQAHIGPQLHRERAQASK